MEGEYIVLLNEIRETLKVIADGQAELIKEVKELKEEQKKLYNEIRLNNSAMSYIALKAEIIN